MQIKFILLLLLVTISSAFSAEIPTYLDKELDQKVLESTFSLTNRQLIDYIKSQGVDVVYLPLNALPNSPLDAQLISIMATPKVYDRWIKFFEDNRVIGKFFSLHDSSGNFAKPTIIITDLNDKWTLLHEFIHFLFEKNLIDTGKYDSTLYVKQSNDREDFLEQFPKLRDGHKVSDTEVDNVIQIFRDYVLSEVKIAKGLTLEEVVVEKTISNLYSQGAILYLNDEQKHNADTYIQENLMKVTSQLNSYFEIYADLQKALNGRSSPTLNESLNGLNWLKNEIEKLSTTTIGT